MDAPSPAGDPGIRLILEQIRDLRREAAVDRKQATEDRKRFEERLIRIEEKQDRTMAKLDKSLGAIAKALQNLTEVTDRLYTATLENNRILKSHTALLHDIRRALRPPGRNGGGNGKHVR